MTDDDRLAALFRAAASEVAPPPGFDHRDVLAASRRITARRRTALAGAGLTLFALVGVGVAAAVPETPTAATVAAAGGAAERSASAPSAAPEGAGDAAGPAAAAAPPQVPADPTFRGAPLGPGTGPCADRQDPQLRAYLEQVLPEAVGAAAAAGTDECRPGGERYVTVEVTDHGMSGLLAVAYLPPGTPADPASRPGTVSAPTASGGTVIVSSGPAGGTVAPFADRLAAIANYLAPRL